MNPYQINELHRKAQECSNYLSQTNAGAIKLDMRYNSIHAMCGLSAALQNQEAINGNLQAELRGAYSYSNQQAAYIASLQAAMTSEGAKTSEALLKLAEERKTAAGEAAAIRAHLEKEREDLVRKNEEELIMAENNFKKQLADALEEIENMKRSKQKVTQTLSMALDFAKDQGDALVGWMVNKYDILDKQFPAMVADLAIQIRENPDMELGDQFMIIINGIENLRLTNAASTTQPLMIGGSSDLDPHNITPSKLTAPEPRQG